MCSFLAPMTTGDCHGHRRALHRSRIYIYGGNSPPTPQNGNLITLGPNRDTGIASFAKNEL